jgi:hypothetical protein
MPFQLAVNPMTASPFLPLLPDEARRLTLIVVEANPGRGISRGKANTKMMTVQKNMAKNRARRAK